MSSVAWIILDGLSSSRLTTCLWRAQVAKIQREHDAREVQLRKAQEHYESVKKTAGPSAECAHAVVKCLSGYSKVL